MLKLLLNFLCICLLLLFWSVAINAQNQQLTFERVTAEQGLTSNRINGIVQDQQGFIWIATNNGLNRYDGFENKQYTKLQDDTTSLSNNSVLALYCDSGNQLWILTINYLHRYNRKLDNFDRFLISEINESYRYENKGFIVSDKSGNIWVGTPTNGLFCMNKQEQICKNIAPEIKAVSSIYSDQEGKIWIGSENGMLTRYDPDSKKTETFKIPDGIRRTVKDDFIWKIWPENKENLIYSSQAVFFNLTFFQVNFRN
jgi:ligand-binding sensor domain-containing protein